MLCGYFPGKRMIKNPHPNINFRSLILLALKHLRRSIWRRSAPSCQIRGWTPEVGETKIGNFYVHVRIQKEIFRFQVPMNDSPKNFMISLLFWISPFPCRNVWFDWSDRCLHNVRFAKLKRQSYLKALFTIPKTTIKPIKPKINQSTLKSFLNPKIP